MDAATSLATQQRYRGWAFIGGVFVAALVANVIFAVQLRARGVSWAAAAIAAIATACSLIVFVALRAQWEYSHVIGAAFLFIALVVIAMAASNSAAA